MKKKHGIFISLLASFSLHAAERELITSRIAGFNRLCGTFSIYSEIDKKGPKIGLVMKKDDFIGFGYDYTTAKKLAINDALVFTPEHIGLRISKTEIVLLSSALRYLEEQKILKGADEGARSKLLIEKAHAKEAGFTEELEEKLIRTITQAIPLFWKNPNAPLPDFNINEMYQAYAQCEIPSGGTKILPILVLVPKE